jgi:hypothetical protein
MSLWGNDDSSAAFALRLCDNRLHYEFVMLRWRVQHLITPRKLRADRRVVRNLRQKLEADPARPRLIRNEVSVGYRLIEG